MALEHKLLIGAVKASVTGIPAQMEAEPDWPLFLKLAAAHKVEALCYDGLQKSNIPLPEAAGRVLGGAYMQAIFRDSQIEYRKDLLQKALAEACVPHIFLKGSVLKHDYPVPALRTMCDMDVLVYAKDFDALDTVAKAMDGVQEEGDGNHRNYRFPDGVLVEFHPNLLHHATAVARELNPGWQYAKESEGFAKELTEEGFYLNTMCHLMEHFVSSGVGIRFVLDIWVSRHLRKAPIDRAFVEEELTRFGLLEFAKNIEALADVWFGDEPMTDLLEELGKYILTSGSYGTESRAILNALSLSPGGSRFSALMKKAFYPKAELEDRFPWCKGKPLLLPVAWFCRAFKAVTNNGHLIAKWGKDTGKIDKAAIAAHQETFRRFGIRVSK